MANIPSDLVIDILLKLPVKSLCRFKCLSKSFMALINDPQFVHMHLTQTQSRRQILARGGYDFGYLDLGTSPPNDSKFVKLKPDFLKEMEKTESKGSHRRYIHMIGSCNGLLCLSICLERDRDVDYEYKHVFFIYNPATRESKRIPDVKPNNESKNILYGFGYAPRVDDYKFLQVSCNGSNINIFSLKTNTWKSVELKLNLGHNLPNHFRQPGVFLNGAIHWRFELDRGSVIAAFDLSEEEYKFFPDPRAPSPVWFKLFVLGAQLCISYWHHGHYRREDYGYWVMKEYGIRESWTKISFPFRGIIRPLCFLKNTDSVLVIRPWKKWLLYDLKNGNVKEFVDFDGIETNCIDVLLALQPCLESLVSPH